MIGQAIGLDAFVPLALSTVEDNPLAAGDYYGATCSSACWESPTPTGLTTRTTGSDCGISLDGSRRWRQCWIERRCSSSLRRVGRDGSQVRATFRDQVRRPLAWMISMAVSKWGS